MRIIKVSTLQQYARKHARAASSINHWTNIAKQAEWKDINDTRQTFSNADAVQVKSGRTITVFNVGGNNFRLITAIHYNRGLVFILDFMTHAEYDKNKWKEEL